MVTMNGGNKMTEQKKSQLALRNELPVEDTWALEAIFASEEAWEEEYAAVKALIPSGSHYVGRLAESADVLYEALQLQDNIDERMGRLYAYAHMRSDQDTANTLYQAMDGRIRTLDTESSSTFSYMTPELLDIPEEKLNQFVEEKAEMSVYKQGLKELNIMRPHVLPAEQEAILAEAGDVIRASSKTFSVLNNADLKFPNIKNEQGEEVELTHGRYTTFLESANPKVREAAFKAMYKVYGDHRNTFASTLNGQIKADNFNAKVRHFDSARHAALKHNAIPEAVYDNLISTVNDHLPLLHRYVKLRKQVLGLEELHMYDLYTPIVKEVKMEIPYELAKEHVLNGLKPLGSEYQSILKEGFENRWVDVHENRGKRSGAYSSGSYGTNPYILMNWQDNVNNLFTLAHEFGHSVHSYYTRQNQPYQTGNYSIFVAEVASTCNEALVNDYLLKTVTDEKQRLYLLNHYLETFRGTLFRQTMFAEFEHIIHQYAQTGESLTAEWLTAEYYALNKKYFGDELVIDEEIGLEWSRIPHFYYHYYVYQYATGFSAASALSKQILEEGQPAVDRYINQFLKAGSSDFPIEVLKRAGVDMNTPKPIEEAMKVFDATLTELEKILLK